MSECITCKKDFKQKASSAGKYCSHICYWESKKGKPVLRNAYIWSEERKKAWSESRKGICFNTGRTHFKKGQVSLNKGKKLLHQTGIKHFAWKGENVGYIGLHNWVRRNLGTPKRCDNKECIYPRKDARGYLMKAPKRFEWANISHQYKRILTDWVRLCSSCHHKYDHGKEAIFFGR